MHSLIERLTTLGEAVNELTDSTINHGGCGVYAALVAERLEELGIAEVEVITTTYGEGAFSNVRDNLPDPANATAQEWEDEGMSFHHLGVRFKLDGEWHTADSNGVNEGERWKFGSHCKYGATADGLSVQEALSIAAFSDGWNSAFDRRLIPEIGELVREYLQ